MSGDSEINEISILMNDRAWHDIDGGLAADFDGSLSGLGVEIGANAYNMSEALLALPVFKQEHLDDLNKINSSSAENTLRAASSNVFQQVVAYGSRFQYIMSAATSPATKMNEETITYLNQGQSYEVKIKKLGDLSDCKGQYYRSVIRVTFHDRRLQFMEKEQLETWKQTRPGDRIFDIDIPLSYGAIDMKVDPNVLNAAEFIWDPKIDTGIFVRVHCISTEFTPKKHGGEKGVPFRIQVDTYTHPQDGSIGELIHSASSQIKVFKPKGADRKHKTDRDKIEKINESEKKNYQPSYECTVLTEIPPDQMYSMKSTVNTVNSVATTTSSSTLHTSTTEKRKWSPKVRTNRTPRKRSVSSPNNWAASRTSPTGSVGMPSPSPSPNSDTSSVIGHTRLDAEFCLLDSGEFSPLSPDASANQVSEWLHQNRFYNFSRIFQNFSGADLLRLSRDDLIQICGLADGIRLNNALQSKIIRPKLSVFVSQEGEQVYHALYLELLDYNELVSKLAALYNLPAEKVADVYLQGPSGIHILVTDEVIQNITDQSRFNVDALNDQSNDTYRILLKTVD
ncbi:transcription factor CP2-like isoform X2 [Tubulanus polymorphus]|uniref:transcription factor CP2-like isoform X2 n=1 Tax=Tubulanus polymorphus TaxID=672921 RepID=UPI003DA47E7F